MRTEVRLLPVYNHLYNLGLTDEQLEKIIKKESLMKDSPFVYNFIANETLVRIETKTNYWGKKNNIELSPVELNIESALVSNCPCYSISYGNTEYILKFDILALDEEETANVIQCLQLTEENNLVVNDVESLKDVIKNKYKNKFFTTENVNDICRGAESKPDTVTFFKWVLNMSKETSQKANPGTDLPRHIGQIVEVYEKNNIRLSKAIRESSYIDRYKNSSLFFIADVKNEIYNYLDVGRTFYVNSRGISSWARTIEELKYTPKLFMLDNTVIISPNEDVYKEIEGRYADKKAVLLDTFSVESVIRRLERKKLSKSQEEQKLIILKKKVLSKVDELEEGGSLKLNGILFNKEKIEYSGQVLQCEGINVAKVLAHFATYRKLEDINFDNVTDTFIQGVENSVVYAPSTKKIKGILGEVTFTLENRINVNQNGVKTRYIYINNHRVKRDEISQILNRALCFETQKAFNSFVSQVSKCSLELHKYLNNGIELSVSDDYTSKNIFFKIPLLRASGKNYIFINNKKYGVSNTNALINMARFTRMHEVINTLLNPKVVRIDGPDDIADIIRKGEELHQKDKNKNREMIERVEKIFNLEIEEVKVSGVSSRGYIINGKMSQYFLDIGKTDKETIFDRLRVYSYPDMQYVCMLDKSVKQTGPSNLVNRIFALHNDSMVAKEITTLNQKK
jgi:hypothetical protein